MKNNVILSYITESAAEILGKNLKTARLRRNESAEFAANKLGISRKTLLRLEKGDTTISLGIFLECLNLYGFEEQLLNLANPDEDKNGRELDLKNLRQRGRGNAKNN